MKRKIKTLNISGPTSVSGMLIGYKLRRIGKVQAGCLKILAQNHLKPSRKIGQQLHNEPACKPSVAGEMPNRYRDYKKMNFKRRITNAR